MEHVLSVIKCPNCNELVRVDETREPLRYVTREADTCEPRAFLIIGRDSFNDGDWLLHRCLAPKG
jgi:hypothetical protein